MVYYRVSHSSSSSSSPAARRSMFVPPLIFTLVACLSLASGLALPLKPGLALPVKQPVKQPIKQPIKQSSSRRTFDPFYTTLATPILLSKTPTVPPHLLSPLPIPPSAHTPHQPPAISSANVPATYKSLLTHFRPSILQSMTLRITNSLLQLAPPLLIGKILNQIATNTHPTTTATTCLLLYITSSLKTIIENLYFQSIVATAFSATHLLRTNLFNKLLHAQSNSINTSPNVLGTMENTVSGLSAIFLNIHTLYDAPLQVRRERARKGRATRARKRTVVERTFEKPSSRRVSARASLRFESAAVRQIHAVHLCGGAALQLICWRER